MRNLACLLLTLLPALASATDVRTPEGRPGPGYWQQQVDYRMTVRLDPAHHRLQGESRVTYHNNAPQPLSSLWFQLEQERFRPDSRSAELGMVALVSGETASPALLAELAAGYQELTITDSQGRALQTQRDDTFIEIRLAQPLAPGDHTELRFGWTLQLLDRSLIKARAGYEKLPSGQPAYLAAQWFPRAAVYHDDGWQLAPFLGQGEFSLEFGNYDVTISVPADYLVAATGELTNASTVLSPGEFQRYQSARSGQRETVAAPGREGEGEQHWQFTATDVRDFAFAASPAFSWQAEQVEIAGKSVFNQAFFPAAGAHLWARYSLDAAAHAMQHYSAWLFPYPFPTLSSVNIAGWGMEYPMLAVIGERGHSEMARWDMIGGIIHETGHSWFPMAVNSNERQYAWLDEGLVSFIEYHAEKAWDPDFVIVYGEPTGLERYRGQPYQQPLMTEADALSHRIANAYDFAAAALNILRSDVMGPARFDAALKVYAQRWNQHRATAPDFFNTMEDASGMDLQAFWQQWFYGLGFPPDNDNNP